jgi:hypothetical protein
MRVTEFLVRYASLVLIAILGMFAFFAVGATMVMLGAVGLEMALGFLTGVDGPLQHETKLNTIGKLGGWLTVVAGWLAIPTMVAFMLGRGERAADQAKDTEFLAFMLATRLGFRGEERDKFVRRLREKHPDLLQQ